VGNNVGDGHSRSSILAVTTNRRVIEGGGGEHILSTQDPAAPCGPGNRETFSDVRQPIDMKPFVREDLPFDPDETPTNRYFAEVVETVWSNTLRLTKLERSRRLVLVGLLVVAAALVERLVHREIRDLSSGRLHRADRYERVGDCQRHPARVGRAVEILDRPRLDRDLHAPLT
jgi:hypothetical protein